MADKLVVGCGYLGRRIAALWCAQNHRVFAMTRSTARADEWRARGLQPILCDGVPGTPCSTPAGLVLARSGSIGVRPRQDRCDRTVSGRAFALGRSAPADLQEFRSSGDTIPNCLAVIRSIFSTCNALCQGGLLTLLDVPPSVCYPSGRRWQQRGPKPGEQRNLDLRIGRESASRHDDC
jgi:hypothetical protein